jgi:hypothetical protein
MTLLAIAKTDHELHHDRAQRIDAVPRVLDHPTASTHVRTVGTVLITGESGTGLGERVIAKPRRVVRR